MEKASGQVLPPGSKSSHQGRASLDPPLIKGEA
jgi:hypothetical protein